ncbi:MAG: flavodoxin [Actinobacteria bacterium]|nr:flavodoxin [Actinomycetota bacterium]
MTDQDRVLVAYGTKYGSTAEIAERIGATLSAAGLAVDVRAAREVKTLDPYRAVVLGSAVYAGRWRRDALRLLRRPELEHLDVWLFSSGPVGEQKTDHSDVDRWTRPPKVDHLAEKIGAHDHVGFGGMVAEDAGFMRKRMARGIPPDLRDLRDWRLIEAWARGIAGALTREASAA